MSKKDIEFSKDSVQNRRDFISWIIGGGVVLWLASIIYPITKYLQPPAVEEVKVTSLKIGKVEDMEKDSGKVVKFGNKPVIVIRLASGEYKAFSANCTHLDCIVQYSKNYGQIYCACHNGRYDLNGKNVSGPPPAPLTTFSVSIKGDEVIVFKEST